MSDEQVSGSGDVAADETVNGTVEPDLGKGFPLDTPIKDMTDAERADYWRDKAQKHEKTAKGRADYDVLKAERDELRNRNEGDLEKAVREAREEGAREARESSFNTSVSVMLRMALNNVGVKSPDIDEHLSTLNFAAFADSDGKLDEEKLARHVQRFTGTVKTQWPDTGQSSRGDTARNDRGVQAGVALHDRLYKPASINKYSNFSHLP